jgi:hypothetical protein
LAPRRMTADMAVREYDAVFVGGGLAASLLLQELKTALPDRVAVVDPYLPAGAPARPLELLELRTAPYDRFAIGVWRQAG